MLLWFTCSSQAGLMDLYADAWITGQLLLLHKAVLHFLLCCSVAKLLDAAKLPAVAPAGILLAPSVLHVLLRHQLLPCW